MLKKVKSKKQAGFNNLLNCSMPIFLQKISDDNFNADTDFHVKESRGCNLTMGILLLAITLLIIVSDLSGALGGPFIKIFYLLIIPAILFIRRGSANNTVMTINKNGFFYAGQLLTSWENFIDAA